MKKILFFIAFTLFASGCAMIPYDGINHTYSGNGTVSDLIAARYACTQELSGKGGTGNNNVNVNISRRGNNNLNCGAFASCVAGKGFLRDSRGSIQLPSSYVVSCNR